MVNKSFRLTTLSLGMLLAFGAIQPAQANIVADSNAVAGLRPDVTETQGGIPQVNIQAPSAGGVSRNVYSEFNIDGRGVILNNSHSDTYTSIGGNVTGNAALANGGASIILNEVNSRDPSQLNGMIEVAGQRAEVVIANPSGITCNGCGFINASRGTLTTGQAMVENGVLTGYRVEDGAVAIEEQGLSGMQDYTDIIARSVKINSQVQAEVLNITTGRNVVDAQNSTVTRLADSGTPKPELALDVTSLGSIYTGKIRMIGTEKGVGVNHSGFMLASDNVEITADGEINNSGFLQAEGGIQLNAQSVRNSNIIYSSGDISIDSESLNNTAGMIYSGQGDVVIKSGAVDNRQGSILGRDVVVTAETVNNEAGGLEGYNNVVVQVTSLNNKDGLIQAGSDLQLTIKDGVDPQGAINVAGTTIQWNEERNEELDIGSIMDEFYAWQQSSGFAEALAELLKGSSVNTTAVWQNNDIMAYLYLTYTSGKEMTAELLEAISRQVFGSRPESEYAQNIEQVRLIAELIEICVAGNCKKPNEPAVPEPEIPSDETPQPDGNSVPGREIDFTSKDEFNSWQSGSGFRTALTKLLGHSEMKTSAVLQNDDIMTYLYLTYTSGTEMTADILEAVSNQVFGLRPESEYEQNIEEVRIIAELMESCLAGNCL